MHAQNIPRVVITPGNAPGGSIRRERSLPVASLAWDHSAVLATEDVKVIEA